MTKILANYTTSISELKKSPSTVIEKAGDEVVAILNHNRPSAYLVPAKRYEEIRTELNQYRSLLSSEKVTEQTEEDPRLEDWDGCNG
jgi:antitoxin StbD